MKRGQLTLFLVLGLVIVVAIGLGLYFSGAISKAQKARESVEASKALEQSKDVQKLVEDCILETTKQVIPLVYAQGGYFVMPERSVIYLHYDIPIYMDEGKDNSLTLDDVEREVSIGIDALLSSCLSTLTSLGNVQIAGNSDSSVEITDSKVVVETNLPLIIGGEVQSKLVGFYVEYQKNVKEVYDEAKKAYDEVKDIKGIVPISRIAFLAEEKDYDFVSDNVGEAQLYIIRFNQTLIKEEPVEFTFAVYNPLKEGDKIIDGEDDFSELFGLFVPEEEEEEEAEDEFSEDVFMESDLSDEEIKVLEDALAEELEGLDEVASS